MKISFILGLLGILCILTAGCIASDELSDNSKWKKMSDKVLLKVYPNAELFFEHQTWEMSDGIWVCKSKIKDQRGIMHECITHASIGKDKKYYLLKLTVDGKTILYSEENMIKATDKSL